MVTSIEGNSVPSVKVSKPNVSFPSVACGLSSSSCWSRVPGRGCSHFFALASFNVVYLAAEILVGLLLVTQVCREPAKKRNPPRYLPFARYEADGSLADYLPACASRLYRIIIKTNSTFSRLILRFLGNARDKGKHYFRKCKQNSHCFSENSTSGGGPLPEPKSQVVYSKLARVPEFGTFYPS